jgi:alkaline phosphatase
MEKRKFYAITTGALLLMVTASWPALFAQNEHENGERPKNVILLIGDGMGISQLSTAYYFRDDKDAGREPAFSRFRHIGLCRTSPATEAVTQSSAAATALATGHKTYNTAIGVDRDTIVRENIVELVSKKGMRTGVIATSYVTDATPAGFYAHQPERYMFQEIAMDLLESDIDFFAGGGSAHFRDSTGIYPFDEYNIDLELKKLKKIRKPEAGKRYGFLLKPERMPTMLEGRGDFLAQASAIAIDFLSTGESGYFLMAEGAQIDWAGHGNQAEYMIAEVNDFERTIDEVLDYAEKDGETLVIVTADHETGGFTLGAAGDNYNGADYSTITPTFATTNHSAALVPVFAYGPGAENFMGVYENTEIFHKLVSLIVDH